jgi:hypothetical protein
VGSHTHASQTFPFQMVDLVDQGSHLRGFKGSRLLTPSSLEPGELAYKGGEAGLMGLTIEPGSMPSSKRAFQRKIKEAGLRESLKANAPDNLSVGGARLVVQEK